MIYNLINNTHSYLKIDFKATECGQFSVESFLSQWQVGKETVRTGANVKFIAIMM